MLIERVIARQSLQRAWNSILRRRNLERLDPTDSIGRFAAQADARLDRSRSIQPKFHRSILGRVVSLLTVGYARPPPCSTCDVRRYSPPTLKFNSTERSSSPSV
ncbi:hypothetical protein GA0061091_11934 [Gordonia sp. v-85]|nr:hypothetical protein GA0061091_11934 [Gordonia sp. v-85]